MSLFDRVSHEEPKIYMLMPIGGLKTTNPSMRYKLKITRENRYYTPILYTRNHDLIQVTSLHVLVQATTRIRNFDTYCYYIRVPLPKDKGIHLYSREDMDVIFKNLKIN